jgi:HPr kinase/phosphorylase
MRSTSVGKTTPSSSRVGEPHDADNRRLGSRATTPQVVVNDLLAATHLACSHSAASDAPAGASVDIPHELSVTLKALQRLIEVPRIQKPGLALAGWHEQLHSHRLLVLGGTEIDYLEAASAETRTLGITTLLASEPACVVVCRNRRPPLELLRAAHAVDVAVLTTALVTAEFIAEVTSWLSVQLAATTTVHGVMLEILGIGILVTGKSGIGKSETALDLVVRGHRLIADDAVQLRRVGSTVTAHGTKIIGHHMEIRGLGIINIKDLFGIAAVRESKKVELVVELVEWSADEEYERLGLDDDQIHLLDAPVPRVRLPVRPGRNIATLVEVAARNQLLKEQGYYSARAFRDQLVAQMTAPGGDSSRSTRGER